MSVPEIPCEIVDVPESLNKNAVTTLLSEMRCGGCSVVLQDDISRQTISLGRGNNAWEAIDSSHDEVNVAVRE